MFPGPSAAKRRVPCVGALVHDDAGRLLVVRRAREPAAGSWSVPGGRVEPRETDHDAVVREVLGRPVCTSSWGSGWAPCSGPAPPAPSTTSGTTPAPSASSRPRSPGTTPRTSGGCRDGSCGVLSSRTASGTPSPSGECCPDSDDCVAERQEFAIPPRWTGVDSYGED